MSQVLAEISPDGKAIVCTFSYDFDTKERVKSVPGARFVERGHDPGLKQPHWRFHLGLQTGRNLRGALGRDLKIGPNLTRWGHEEVQRERNLKELSSAKSAKLTVVPEKLPLMWDLIQGRPIPGFPENHALSGDRDPRPYQTADIKLMAEANVLNANGMGTGKTIESIGSVFEAEIDEGAHLVVAPITAHVDPWVQELERYQPHPILFGRDPKERKEQIKWAAHMHANDEAFWLIIGFHELRLKRGDPQVPLRPTEHFGYDKHQKRMYPLISDFMELFEIDWASVRIDESHKSGLANPHTMFARAAHKLTATRRQSMSGTPMGGKPIRLWGHLHWLEPKEYSSMWRWADTWLDVSENDYGGKEIGNIQKGKIDEFGEAHLRHIVRRTKREALPGLPPKQYIDVWVDMTPAQKKQYLTFEAEAEIRIEDERLSATSVLAEYTRLKQLSNAKCIITTRVVKRRATGVEEILRGLQATKDSPKVEPLLNHLDENGIRKSEPEPGARAIVASQSKDMTYMVLKWLKEQGISAQALTGDTKQGPERDKVINWYKEEHDEARVLCMTTWTGGVSLNLEMTGSVHILDETWNPDDQEQLEERGDRGTRTTPLICYYYRTRDTIQEAIYQRALGKSITNKNILDFRATRISGNGELEARIAALRARRSRAKDDVLL